MKPTLWIVPSALLLAAACGGESSESPAAQPAASPAPAVEEALPTEEEAAIEAESSIDASNADAELKRLQEELGGG